MNSEKVEKELKVVVKKEEFRVSADGSHIQCPACRKTVRVLENGTIARHGFKCEGFSDRPQSETGSTKENECPISLMLVESGYVETREIREMAKLAFIRLKAKRRW